MAPLLLFSSSGLNLSLIRPASRCCSWALSLSVQECEDCITSVILPAARKQAGSVGVDVYYFYCGELKGIVCVSFPEELRVESPGWSSSPASAWAARERILISTTLGLLDGGTRRWAIPPLIPMTHRLRLSEYCGLFSRLTLIRVQRFSATSNIPVVYSLFSQYTAGSFVFKQCN